MSSKFSSLINSENFEQVFSLIPNQKLNALRVELEKVEKELISKEYLLTKQDPIIVELINKRENIKSTLVKKYINFLKSQKLKYQAEMESAMRPKGVLSEYKNLLRQAKRDELTLINLENNLRVVELEKARIDDPWELITESTLLRYPVAPKRKNIAFIGLILGFLGGAITSFLKENKSGRIFELDILKKHLSVPLLDKITLKNDNLELESISYTKQFLQLQQGKKVCFIFSSRKKLYLQCIYIIGKDSLYSYCYILRQ